MYRFLLDKDLKSDLVYFKENFRRKYSVILYTIGHSTYDLDYFINILKHYHINCVVDVRSTPYSKYSSQYNKEFLSEVLKSNNIAYIHMGVEFGARRLSKDVYTKEGYVDFEKVKDDPDFLKGIASIKVGLKKGYRIAFMCTEKKPEECHRCILVGRNFKNLGYKVLNIINERECKSQEDIEKELLEIYYPMRNQVALLDDMNLSNRPDKELINDVYKLINKEIGYKEED